MIDNATKNRIATLHPSVRVEVAKIIEEINTTRLTGVAKCIITQGMRTFAEQDALYAKGRTVKGDSGVTAKKPLGNTVTKAKAGQSVHNYGFAVDIALGIDRNGDGKFEQIVWDEKKDFDNDMQADWMECVAVFKKYGWTWGGDWRSFTDLPHFDKKGFGDWKVLSKMKKDANGYIII